MGLVELMEVAKVILRARELITVLKDLIQVDWVCKGSFESKKP